MAIRTPKVLNPSTSTSDKLWPQGADQRIGTAHCSFESGTANTTIQVGLISHIASCSIDVIPDRARLSMTLLEVCTAATCPAMIATEQETPLQSHSLTAMHAVPGLVSMFSSAILMLAAIH